MTSGTLGFQRAPPADLAGSVHVTVARSGQRTRPVTVESFGHLRVMKPVHLDDSGQLSYIIVNSGGALFAERYELAFDLQPESHLLVYSQSATRIHRTADETAVQQISMSLASGSRFEFVPDQTIAYRDADYRQGTTITAAPDAQAFIGEIVTPGWDPDGVMFTYAGMHLRIEVRAEHTGRVAYVDNVRIRPEPIGTAISGIGYLEGASHMASVLILGEHTRGDYADRVRQVIQRGRPVEAGVTVGERHGVAWLLVRALGDSTDALREMIWAVNELDRALTTGQGRLDLRRY